MPFIHTLGDGTARRRHVAVARRDMGFLSYNEWHQNFCFHMTTRKIDRKRAKIWQTHNDMFMDLRQTVHTHTHKNHTTNCQNIRKAHCQTYPVWLHRSRRVSASPPSSRGDPFCSLQSASIKQVVTGLALISTRNSFFRGTNSRRDLILACAVTRDAVFMRQSHLEAKPHPCYAMTLYLPPFIWFSVVFWTTVLLDMSNKIPLNT